MRHIIALVEDDEDVRSTFSMLLDPLGETLCFDSAAALLDHLTKQPNIDLDLIITDFNMPKMTGVQMVEAVRSKGVTCPAILVSGHVDKDTAINAVNASVCTILEKPVDSDVLVNTAQRLLETRELEKLRFEIAMVSEQLQELMAAFREICINELELTAVIDPENVIDEGGESGGESLNDSLISLELRLQKLRSSEKSIEHHVTTVKRKVAS